MSIESEISTLIEKYQYETKRDQSEADVRADYIDILFAALGWNTKNDIGEHTNYRRETYIRGAGIVDVILEIEEQPSLMIEAKKFGKIPRSNERIGDRTLEEKQLFRYARGKKIPYCILTNFERIQVFNADHERLILWFDEPEELLSRLAELLHLSPEKVKAGSLPATERQLEIKPIDQEFLSLLQNWRLVLANTIYKHNFDKQILKNGDKFDFGKLMSVVQRLLDRLILIRYADDKEVLLTYDVIENIMNDYHKKGAYASDDYLLRELTEFSRMMDNHHNTTIFQPGHICEQVFIPNDVLEKIMVEINNISFRKFTSDILGNTYETYLGTKLVLKNGAVSSEERDDIRKSGGIYYTPSFIVHYMVDNTLGERIRDLEAKDGLQSIEKVKDIKIIDPACGSGSFLIYAYKVLAEYYKRMNHVIEIELNKLLAIGPKADMFKRMELLRKLPEPLPEYPHYILEKQIYGVDLDPEAAEIAAVNLTMQAFADSKKEKLPLILNKNVRVGNSLISGTGEELQKIYGDSWREQKAFNWAEEFPEIMSRGGFDIVVTNPPYVGNKGHKEEFQPIQQSNLGIFYERRMDLFYFFFHLGLNITTVNANLAFITTNYYLTATGGIKLRQDIKLRSVIKQLINFNELKIFESALGQHNMVTILGKIQDENYIASNCITKRQGVANADLLKQIVDGNDPQTNYYKVRQGDLFDGDEQYIRLTGVKDTSSSVNLQSILNKMKLQATALGVICNLDQGIVSGADKVTSEIIKKYPGLNLEVDDGIFILSKKEVQKLSLSQTEINGIIKPFYKNSDIHKWMIRPKKELFIIYLKDEGTPITLGPNLMKHFRKYERILVDKKKNCFSNKWLRNIVEPWLQRGNWFVLFYPRNREIFENEKIVNSRRAKSNVFALENEKRYEQSDIVITTVKKEYKNEFSIKYLLGLLNSHLFYLWLYNRGKRKGETLELYQKPLSEIPIKKASESVQKPIITLVDNILKLMKQSDYLENNVKQERVKEFESQIDLMVYHLYELTPEEIAIASNE